MNKTFPNKGSETLDFKKIPEEMNESQDIPSEQAKQVKTRLSNYNQIQRNQKKKQIDQKGNEQTRRPCNCPQNIHRSRSSQRNVIYCQPQSENGSRTRQYAELSTSKQVNEQRSKNITLSRQNKASLLNKSNPTIIFNEETKQNAFGSSKEFYNSELHNQELSVQDIQAEPAISMPISIEILNSRSPQAKQQPVDFSKRMTRELSNELRTQRNFYSKRIFYVGASHQTKRSQKSRTCTQNLAAAIQEEQKQNQNENDQNSSGNNTLVRDPERNPFSPVFDSEEIKEQPSIASSLNESMNSEFCKPLQKLLNHHVNLSMKVQDLAQNKQITNLNMLMQFKKCVQRITDNCWRAIEADLREEHSKIYVECKNDQTAYFNTASTLEGL